MIHCAHRDLTNKGCVCPCTACIRFTHPTRVLGLVRRVIAGITGCCSSTHHITNTLNKIKRTTLNRVGMPTYSSTDQSAYVAYLAWLARCMICAKASSYTQFTAWVQPRSILVTSTEIKTASSSCCSLSLPWPDVTRRSKPHVYHYFP